MEKFNFRLERVLKIREAKRRECENRLEIINSQINAINTQIQKIKDKIQENQQTVTDINSQVMLQNFIASSQNKLTQLDLQLDSLKEVRDEALTELTKAKQEEEIIIKLKEKYSEDYNYRFSKEEEEFLTENFLINYVRTRE